jgi:hypothetical protein
MPCSIDHTASQCLTPTEHSHSLDKPCETLAMDITPQQNSASLQLNIMILQKNFPNLQSVYANLQWETMHPQRNSASLLCLQQNIFNLKLTSVKP